MSSTPKFAHVDTKRPNGFYVKFERIVIDDDSAQAPDKMQDGYWPSQDPTAAGYVGQVDAKTFKRYQTNAKRRMTNWERGHWRYVGVRARAHCLLVANGVGTYVDIDSPGMWGIESDAGDDYLNQVYLEEQDAIQNMLFMMKEPIYEK